MESEIKDFWQGHPCGASLVGDMDERSADSYRRFFDRYDAYRYEKESHILRKLDTIDLNGKRVLEIGLGQGADAEQLIRRGAIYTGVDLTTESVERVKMRFELRGLKYEGVHQGSALDLPFDDSNFDIVYSFGVLHHIPDIEQAQAEIARVLKSDGRLIAMFYAKWSLNYLLSIAVVRRLGLLAMYGLGIRGSGIYAEHYDAAKRDGLWNYLQLDNFVNVSTDGPGNPYSKVYDRVTLESDFSEFEIVSTEKDFMHAPPLPVKQLPLAKLLGWHLWATMKKNMTGE